MTQDDYARAIAEHDQSQALVLERIKDLFRCDHREAIHALREAIMRIARMKRRTASPIDVLAFDLAALGYMLVFEKAAEWEREGEIG